MAIRFLHVFDPDQDPRRMREVQRIFRSYYGTVYGDYAERIPDFLRRQAETGVRAILITAERPGGPVVGFALAFHYPDLNSTLLDFIVVDPTVRQRGIGGALYEALREHAERLGSRGLYLEVRPDDPELEPDPAIRRENRARIRFYERYGARIIAGTAYEQKRPERTQGEPYLIFDSLGKDRAPGRDEVRGMIHALLFRKYAYPEGDPYATSLVESVVEDPVSLQPPRSPGTTAPKAPEPREVLRPIKLLVPEQHVLHHVRERGYVERPARVDKILAALKALPGIEVMDVRPHGEEPIRAVHDPDFVEYLRRVCIKLPENEAVYPYVFPIRFPERKPVDEEVQAGYYCIDTFTPLTHNAYIAARAAVDCALTGADLVHAGERLVYAICRPPGHHAERRVYGGFCYFNNAAVAAHMLSADGPVAVLDIDFHHGNGTQDIFYERSDVLTVSIHGDPSYAYPYFAGFADEHGRGAGEGYNHNFPLPEDIADEPYLEVLGRALALITDFAPRWLILSVGLDIAKGDPTGAWAITPEGFERIGGMVASIGLPILAVQEGGYDTRVLGRNARHLVSGLQHAIYERRTEKRGIGDRG
ncbi:MAG TPA: histone deacetylase family protein [Gemmatimonadaceae bacterium]|nr:histone deacetylase family protein [Gemmatimonadaceae bacterium]